MLGLETRYAILKGDEDARPIKKRELGLLWWRLKGIEFDTLLEARDFDPNNLQPEGWAGGMSHLRPQNDKGA